MMMHTLIFAWHDAHVAAIRARANPADLVVSLHLDASALLRAAGIPFHELTDFVTQDDVRVLLEQGYHLAQTWCESFAADCRFEGVSPLANEALSLASFITDGMIARFVFDAVMRRYPVDALLLFTAPIDHLMINDSVLSIDLWVPVWRMLAKERGLPVIPLSSHDEPAVRRPGTMQRVRQAVGIARQILANRIAWQRHFSQTRLGTGAACMVVLISETRRYAGLLDEIAHGLDAPLIPIALGARRTGGVGAYRALALLPGVDMLRIRKAARGWHARFLAFQQSYSGAYPELFANPDYAPHFRAYFLRFLPDSVQIYRDAQTIFRRTHTRAVIAATFPMLSAGSVHAAARDLAVPVLALPHSGGPTDKHMRCRGDRTLVWSHDYARAWASTQGDTPLTVTGLHPSIISGSYASSQVWQSGQRGRARVLLLLATIQTGIRPWADMHQHRVLLERLACVPDHLRDRVEVIFKLHPAHDYRHVYRALVPEHAEHVRIVRDVPLEAVLLTSDLAVLVNVSTSAHLLALAEGIPLLYVSAAGGIIDDYLAISQWEPDMMTANPDQVWDRIESALFDAEARAHLLDINRRYWARLGAGSPDPAGAIREALRAHWS
jgi:hypothetical protein